MVAKQKIKGELNAVRNMLKCHPSDNEIIKQADIKFGQYESYINELLDENNQLTKRINLLRSSNKSTFLTVATKIKSEELYKAQKTEIQKLREEVKRLKRTNEELICKLALQGKEKLGS